MPKAYLHLGAAQASRDADIALPILLLLWYHQWQKEKSRMVSDCAQSISFHKTGGTAMDKQKTVSVCAAMILNCVCAVVWNIQVFVDLAYGFPNVLRIICAIVWDCCAVVWVIRYLKSKKNPTG